MNKTRHDLPLAQRRTLVTLLNARLADLIDLHSHAKQAHWNVRGSNFLALHELFDKVAGSTYEAIDEIAERLVALGGVAEGTVAAVAANSSLKAYRAESKNHANALAGSLATTAKLVRGSIEKAEKADDGVSADLFTGIAHELDKYLWMVEAHLD